MKRYMIQSLMVVSLLAQNIFCFNGDCFPGDPEPESTRGLLFAWIGSNFSSLEQKAVDAVVKLLKEKNKPQAAPSEVGIQQSNDTTSTLDWHATKAAVAKRAAKETLLVVCEEHGENHLNKHLLKDRRFTESHPVRKSLDQKHKKELSLVGVPTMMEFCKKYRN